MAIISGQDSMQSISSKKQGSWEMNISTHQLVWSPEQYRIYGYQPNELSLNDDYFIINTTHPSDIERITNIINRALRSEESYSFKRRIIKKDGNLGFVETKAVIIRSQKGIPAKILGTTVNVEGQAHRGICDYNDPAFFNSFYANYRKTISAEIYKITGDPDLTKDLCQEIFLKAWNNMSKYDPAKGELYTWLINITRNHCKDYLRSKYFRYHQLTQSFERTPADAFNIKKEELEPLYAPDLLFHLPIEQREVIELIFMQGYTQVEVATLKNLPLGTVKTRSRTAIQALRKLILSPKNASEKQVSFC